MPWNYLRWLLPILWMGVIFFLSAQSYPPIPDISIGWFPLPVGKAGHVGEYTILAILAYVALRNLSSKRTRVGSVFLLCLLYAFSDELHQSFVPNRDPSLWDVGLDALGAALGLLLIILLSLLLKGRGAAKGQ